MRPSIRWLCGSICAVLAIAFAGTVAAETPRFPGAAWSEVPLAQSGWSGQRLDQARERSRQLGSTAVVVVQHGAVVASWGEIEADLLLNSARKSLLSALVGIAVGEGRMHLDDTLAGLGIDDTPQELSAEEKAASVRDLLAARSGVYHPANYETDEMRAKRPPRGSHPPGSFWFYNNWDFNALGAIYERATGTSVFDAFARRIAAPIGMQDFDPAQCRYAGGANSRYPAYLFHASARDLARFGLLYLHGGNWNGRQVVPAGWVRESTKSYSTTDRHTGYGYLWWTMPASPPSRIAAPAGSYWAEGNGGQIVFVDPADDLVVVHVARMTREHQVSVGNSLRLVGMILAARPNP